MACNCDEKYLANTEPYFNKICPKICGIVITYSMPSPETQKMVLKEMIDFIHGMSKTTKVGFYNIMFGYTALDNMLKRHVAAIIIEVGRGDVIAIVEWYENMFVHFMKEITCEPQKMSTLTIKIPRITEADLKTPRH